MKLLLATANTHKVQEIAGLLGDAPVELLSLRDFPQVQMPDETGITMPQNALLKAEVCARTVGLPALSDDSGIEVDFLGGAPGVYSARWVEGSDADRTQAILERLKNVPDAERGARYRCAICIASPSGIRLESEATCEGKIAETPRGANGFGYDPIFEITPATGAPAEWIGKSMAEAPPEIKALVSHRARALQKMLAMLRNCRYRI